MKYGKITPFLFVLPTIVGLLLFRLGPIAVAFLASFTKWNVFSPPEWLAFGNYIELLHSDTFWLVFRNTIVFSLVYV